MANLWSVWVSDCCCRICLIYAEARRLGKSCRRWVARRRFPAPPGSDISGCNWTLDFSTASAAVFGRSLSASSRSGCLRKEGSFRLGKVLASVRPNVSGFAPLKWNSERTISSSIISEHWLIFRENIRVLLSHVSLTLISGSEVSLRRVFGICVTIIT